MWGAGIVLTAAVLVALLLGYHVGLWHGFDMGKRAERAEREIAERSTTTPRRAFRRPMGAPKGAA